MRKLGLGKDKPKNKEQHDQQVKAGLQYLTQQTTSVDKDGDKKLTQEEANNAAAKTKSKFKVFKSITPKEQGGNWVFDWTGSKGTKKTDKKTYELSPELKKIISDLTGLPGAKGLTGYLESKKIMPWFKHGFKTQAERALHYHQKGQLVDIEHAFTDKKTGKMSRFDLVVKDVDSQGKDTGKQVVVEVKNWTGFTGLDAKKQKERLGKLENQLKKYKASQKKVLLEWKGPVPNSVSLLCKQLKVNVTSI